MDVPSVRKRRSTEANESSAGERQIHLQLERLLEGLPAGAYVCDGAGLITYFNARAVELWGRAPTLNDPIDRYCGSFKLLTRGGEPLAHEDCWMARALREGRPFEGQEILIERPDGTRVAALAYANPVDDGNGRSLGAVNVLVDISERKALETELRRSRDELDDFFECAAIGLHWVGEDGTILRANRFELEMLGYAAEEYVGRHIGEFHAERDRAAIILSKLAAGEQLEDFESRMICSDGSLKPVAISSNVARDCDGNFLHTRCFTRDITRQKLAEDALRAASARKSEFIAMLGHELRNPLSPIVSSVEFLRRRGPADPELEGARRVIDRQVMHMRRLIDDLLDIGRVSRGVLQLRREHLDLDTVIEAALEGVTPLVEERQHHLDVTLPEETIELFADPVRLSQVVQNLLINAAKYTDLGGRIRLTVAREDGQAVIRVEDNGEGISPDKIDSLFEMFVRAPQTSHEVESGLGVGLTLVRSITELHGGSVSAISDGIGRGSTFTVTIPLERPAAGATKRVSNDGVRAASDVQPRRILIVDDHRDSCESLSMLLQLDGHTTSTALTSVEALEVAASFQPDVVLLDIGLPDRSGLETCKLMRDEPSTREVLIVAVTGRGQKSDKREARGAGFDLHLTKPVDIRELREVLAAGAR